MCNTEVLPFPSLDVDQVDGETSPEKSNCQVLVGTTSALVEADEMFPLVLRLSHHLQSSNLIRLVAIAHNL